MPNRSSLLIAIVLALPLLSFVARADDLPGWPLPVAETAVAMAWSPQPNSLTLVVKTGGAFEVRDLDLTTGKLQDIPARPLGQIKPEPAPNFAFSADGQRVAVVSPSLNPLRGGTLTVLARRSGKFEAVSALIPGDFAVGGITWGAADELYLTAKPYLHPAQLYSIARLAVDSGKFSGVVLKDNIDLVSGLVVLPGRKLLLARAQGYRGEYPTEPVIASWDMEHAQTALLHSEARSLSLQAVDAQQASAVGQGRSSPERWLLTVDGALRRTEKGLTARAEVLRNTPDAKWAVMVIRGRDLTSELDANETYVAMQSLVSGRPLAIAAPCDEFVISPDGRGVAALSKDRRKVYYYSLPAE